jgi:type IV secretion system protein VirB2
MYSALSLSDPPSQSVLLTAVQWLEQLVLGSISTIIAMIAVAAIGFLMLSGRYDLKRSMTVIFGCFILFSAPFLASGLMNLSSKDVEQNYTTPVPSPIFPIFEMPQSQNDDDPYAGASTSR